MNFKALRTFTLILALCLSGVFVYSEDNLVDRTVLKRNVKEYREAIENETDPLKLAELHYKIGFALEKIGRETEATAEYLKVIINYPDLEEINKKAEDRLSRLYDGFSEKSRDRVTRYDERDPQGDPTIFFAYIKSLYENYRNLGQYDRAIHILKTLYDMDSEDPTYIVDMGEIYLHGYGDTEKAILHFKKAIELDPNNPKAYVDLGRAYEKKADLESAMRMYSQAAEISPASPWAMYGLRRIDGIRLAMDKRLIKDWYFIGPFDNSDREGLKKVFPPENKIDLKATYKGKENKDIKWRRIFDYDSSGYVDLNDIIKPNDYAVSYALSYIYSPNDREAQFRLGFEDGIKIWLNDKEIFTYAVAPGGAVLDNELVPVKFQKGWNKLLLKITDTWGSWGFYFRVTDLRGNPVEDLIFDPLKDDTRRKIIYGKIKREKRFKITKIAAIYTMAFSLFLFGLYFMISNILNRIKINRMKEDFISSVSHELKTPISAIKMLAETLKRGTIKHDSRKGQYYDMIMGEADRLTRFITKILDFAKIEKGGKVYYFEKVNVAQLAKTACDIFGEEIRDEALKINFNTEKNEIYADLDKDAILQVVFNLIDNAYKYSKDEKDITINVKEVKDCAQIEVIDKGVGIDKNNIEKIFDKFYRADSDIAKGIKGSGLGLSFVKSVIDEHGGKIAVESKFGLGTKLIISLPLHKEA